jgi:hypothetical protein
MESSTRTLLRTHDRISYLIDDLDHSDEDINLKRLIEYERESLGKLLSGPTLIN